jgi:type VI secretion system protein ImpK
MNNHSTLMERSTSVTTQSPQSKLTHLPVTSPHSGYFRSKLINTSSGINPLISAASALLLCIANLYNQKTTLSAHDLYQKLIHETKAFETQAQTLGYRTETILIARYILCSTLDEKIDPNNWGEENSWYQYRLLNYFHDEDSGSERFFLILERLCNEPGTHIDLLELIYLCLNLGFMGKYQQIENGRFELDKIVEKLYQCIRWQRGEIKKELLIREEPSLSEPQQKTSSTRFLPIGITFILASVLLLTLFLGFNFVMSISMRSLYQQLNNISHSYFL